MTQKPQFEFVQFVPENFSRHTLFSVVKPFFYFTGPHVGKVVKCLKFSREIDVRENN